MRMLLHAILPHEKFNEAVRDGSVGKKMKAILDAAKPEAVYFTEYNGQRSAILIIEVKEPSQVPAYAEPWFLHFNADCRFRIVMSPKELEKAGLDALAKKWA